MTDYDTILAERAGNILKITLNRPDRLNAASIGLVDELSNALYKLEGARCVLITGAGKGFCSGADLQDRAGDSAMTRGDASHRALQNHYNPLISQILRLPVPVITAVNGPAAGIGCSLALAGDFVIAGESAYFLQAFVNIGLVSDGGSTWLLTRAIGRARATRMMMLGEKISAHQAEQWGLIYKTVADSELADEAHALAQGLAEGPTLSYATMKRTIVDALDGTVGEVMLAEAEGQRIAGSSEDAMEGGMAFLQKRKAQFKGR